MRIPIRSFLAALLVGSLSPFLVSAANAQFAQLADLTVTKDGPAQAAAGSNVTYTIHVFNNGPQDSVTATLVDHVPEGTTFVSASPAPGWSCSNPNPQMGNQLVCTKSSVPVGADDVFSVVFNINAGTPGGTTITNGVSISTPPDPDGGSTDPNEENNTAFANTTVPGGTESDIGVTKRADADQSLPDRNITYTIQVTNSGPQAAVNARLEDTLPDDMTFVSLQQTSGPMWSCSSPTAGTNGTVVCTNSSFAPGTSTFVLVGHIPAGKPAGTEYANIATVSAFEDSNPENNTALATTSVVVAIPTLTTQASSSVLLGGAISDTATLSGSLNATGSIGFFAYGPDDTNCGGSPAFTSSVEVNGNGQYNSGPFVPVAPGTYRFVATYQGDINNKTVSTTCNDPNESVVVTAPTPTPSPTPSATPSATPTATPSQAVNLSTRVRAETGERVMIGGFIITGNVAKSVVLRGLGPSLERFGITDLLLDPVIELRGSGGNLIFANDNWKDSQEALILATGLQPSDDRESAMVTALPPGAYTVILTGKNQTTGIGTVEVYDNDQASDSELANISTRGFVQTQDKVMIGGFTLGVTNNPTQIAARGLGPSLSQSGLNNVLADPTLELRDANGSLLKANDDWQSDSTSAAKLTANGLGLPDPKESGIFMLLPGGQFTAILAGKNGGIGVGLVEIYNLR